MAEINSKENANPDATAIFDESDLVDDNAVEFGMDLLTEPTSPAAPAPEPASAKHVEPAARPASQANALSVAADSEAVAVSPLDEANRFIDWQTRKLAQEEERTARQQSATTMGTLVTALKTRRILNGRVDGVVEHDRTTYWLCYLEDITVEIPFEQTWTNLPKDLVGKTDDESLRYQRQFLSRSMGAEIPFILTGVKTAPDGSIVYSASRVAAMNILRRVYFGRNASRPVKIGSDVRAQIMSMGPYTAYVSCCGVDVPIPNYELSHKYIVDVTTSYQVNQWLMLRVVDLKVDEQGNPVEFILSARPIELEKFRKNLKRVVINRNQPPRYQGVVTSIRRDRRRGHVVVNLFLEGIELPAFSRSLRLSLQDELHTGEKVFFEASGIVEPGYVHGTIIRFNRSR